MRVPRAALLRHTRHNILFLRHRDEWATSPYPLDHRVNFRSIEAKKACGQRDRPPRTTRMFSARWSLHDEVTPVLPASPLPGASARAPPGGSCWPPLWAQSGSCSWEIGSRVTIGLQAACASWWNTREFFSWTPQNAHHVETRHEPLQGLKKKEKQKYGATKRDVPADHPRVIRRLHRAGSWVCLLYTSPSPRDQRGDRMPSSA